MAAIEAAFAVSDADGRAFVINGFLNTPNAGFDEMEQRFAAQRGVADDNGMIVVFYEGGSPHDIFSNTTDEFASTYADFVYSTDFNPIWDAHFDLVRRYIDGPWMQYSDIVARSRFGIWGLYEQMGVPNARSTYILSKAAGLSRWWGNVPPQYVGPATLQRTTNESAPIDLRTLFTRNAATFSGINLPTGASVAGNELQFFWDDVDEDTTFATTLYAQTTQGVEGSGNVTFDVDYVEPVVLPDPDYRTTFADATGLDLRGGASISDPVGNLLCLDDSVNQYAVLEDARTLLTAQPTDEITLSFDYTIAADKDFISFPPIMSSTIFVEENRIRVRLDAGSLATPISAPIIVIDGQPHRITITCNRLTGLVVAYRDGVEIGQGNAGGLIKPFDAQEIRLGASFSGNIAVTFHAFDMWRSFFTAEQQQAID